MSKAKLIAKAAPVISAYCCKQKKFVIKTVCLDNCANREHAKQQLESKGFVLLIISLISQ